jgi:hypothetical protein
VVPGMHTSIQEYVKRPDRAHIKCCNFTRLDKCRDLTSRSIPGISACAVVVVTLISPKLPM